MPVASAELTREIKAPAKSVYALIADYRGGHRLMLPKRYFPRLEVERGGTGDGTVIRFQVRLLARTREVRAAVSEPKPGEVLVETDLATGARTSFSVTDDGTGRACRVSIRTEWNSSGFRGWIERTMAPRALRRIYAEELSQLAAVADGKGGAAAG
jgi:hypothetical protein